MRFVLGVTCLFLGGLLLATPNLTRRELLFAVPVPADFRASAAGRRAILLFRLVVGAALLACLGALWWAPAELLSAVAVAAPPVLLLASAGAFYWQNRAVAPAAVQHRRAREVELSGEPETLPWFAWLGAGPFAILAAVGWWLAANWARIPERFPVHFGIDGAPDRWAERTTKGVYGGLAFAAVLCVWLLVMALAGWYGSRRGRFRSVMLGSLIAVEYLIGILFGLIALKSVLNMPAWVIALAPTAMLIPMLIVMTRKLHESGEAMDPTPNECWKAGIFYYNPDDSALFVEKREGFGYTFNFANRWSWGLLVGLVAVIASTPVLLP